MGVPDVCMLPPFGIPTPFPNIANNALVVPSYFTIMINGLPELNMGAMHAITNGDEAGAMGGVASGMIIGSARPLMGSTCYFVGGMPSWRLTAPTLQNMTNAPGVTMVPGQTVKIVLK